MKTLLLIFLLIATQISSNVYAGTCTSDSFTSNSANSILTSTKYNSDHSTIYDRLAGAFDGGCITDGTVEDGGLNTTDFAVMFNAMKEGCEITKSDDSTVSINRCMLSVNGNFVKTTTATTVAMGCATNCDAEAASTDYYVFAITGSTGTTLTLGLKTGAPNGDSYDGSGNRVLGIVTNDGSSNVSTPSIRQWKQGGLEVGWSAPASYKPVWTGFGTVTDGNVNCDWHRENSDLIVKCDATVGTSTATEAQVTLPSGLVSISAGPTNQIVGVHSQTESSVNDHGGIVMVEAGKSYLIFSNTKTWGTSGGHIPLSGANGNVVVGAGLRFNFKATIPIEGWR